MNIDKSVYADELALMGQALRSAREAAGMSTTDVATRLGVDASTISKLERGVWNPSAGYLIALAGVYGMKWRLDGPFVLEF